jgi:Tfp pilus assembly protein PilF
LERRIRISHDEEWRRFWLAELIGLDSSGESISALQELVRSPNLEVVGAAYESLGDWWERQGQLSDAKDSYRQAIALGGASEPTARLKLANLLNGNGEYAQAVVVLDPLVKHASKMPYDLIQLVLAEQVGSFIRLGRLEDARAVFADVSIAFPGRPELQVVWRSTMAKFDIEA